VVRRVVLALLGVFPDCLAVPVHLLEALKAARVVLAGVHDVAVIEQVRIRPNRPRVDDAPIEVEEKGPVADAEKCEARQGFVRVAEQQFGRALEALVGEGRSCDQGAEDQSAFHDGDPHWSGRLSRGGRFPPPP